MKRTDIQQTDGYLAAGLVRVKESSLMGSDALTRMIDAASADDAYAILGEFDYADELLKENDPYNYEAVLQHDFLQTKQFVSEVTEDPRVMEWLFMEYDFHNMKTFFKELYFSVDLSSYVSRLSVIDAAFIKDAITDDSKTLSHEAFQAVIASVKELKELMGETFTAEYLDAYLDQQYYAMLLSVAKELRDTVAVELTEKRIDLANAKLVLRAKQLSKEFEFVAERFIAGGNFALEYFETRYSDLEERTDLLPAISQRFITSKIEATFSEAQESDKLFDVEHAFEIYEVELARYAKQQAFGLAVLFSYVLSKFIINRNVRRVISGKLNGVSASEITERVTELV